MAIEIRPLRVDDEADVVAMVTNDLRSFSSDLDPEKFTERLRRGMELDRFVVADDDGAVVGNAGAFTMELTVAPDVAVPVSGVTWVAVSPTRRRRGVMRSMLAELHRDARRRGEVAAVLYASESSIYEHVGYGPATQIQPLRILPREVRFRDTAPPEGVEYVEPSELHVVAAPLLDAWRRRRVGAVSEPDRRWLARTDLDHEPGTYAAVRRDRAGVADGYVVYKVKERWNDGFPAHELFVVDLIATSPGAHAALWRFVCSIDLVGEIRAHDVPPDDPLPWLLHAPRAVRTTDVNDGVWVRLLDVAGFFAPRLADVEPSVVVEVPHDEHLDAANAALFGCWALGAGGCVRSSAAPEIVVPAAALGALSLGGHRATVLSAAGRVTELVSGAASRLDDVLRPPHVPHCPTHF